MIVWDLGGVVARFEPAARLASLAQASGLPPDRIEQAIWGSGLDAAAERGELDEADVWRQVLAILDHRLARDELRRCWATAFVPDLEVLAAVRGSGGPVAMLTDNGPILEACLHHELRYVADRFDPVLLSWRLRSTKRDPSTFHAAARALGLDPSELTLVDDSEANVRAARAAGWTAIRFGAGDRGPGSLRPAPPT